MQGGFPRSYLAGSDEDSFAWREGFIRTFLERNPPIGHYHPGLGNEALLDHAGSLSRSDLECIPSLQESMGLSDKTVRLVDILTGTYMVRQLQPWYANLAKRQVKAPKVYLRDSGCLHTLLDLPDYHALIGHPAWGLHGRDLPLNKSCNV